jgi:MFS family permease
VTAAQFIDRFGRRPLFLTATTGMLLMFVAWTISSAVYENSGESNSAAGYVQIPFVWLFGVFYSFAWSGLLVAYALEVLPFKLRAKGLMIMNITVQAILAVGKSVDSTIAVRVKQLLTSTDSQTNPIAWENLPNHWNFTLFYTLWITVELIFVYFVYV